MINYFAPISLARLTNVFMNLISQLYKIQIRVSLCSFFSIFPSLALINLSFNTREIQGMKNTGK